MGAELNTKLLREFCRFCLNKGEYDISTFILDSSSIEVESSKNYLCQYNDELTLENMLLGNSKFSTFDSCNELQLICSICLKELLICYKFLKKSHEANRQIKTILQPADDNMHIAKMHTYYDWYVALEKSKHIIASEVVCTDNIIENLKKNLNCNGKQERPADVRNTSLNKHSSKRTPKFILTKCVNNIINRRICADV